MKKSNVYTRTGDGGQTSLIGGSRVSKSSARLEAYGTVDELTSMLGLLTTCLDDDHDRETVESVQRALFHVFTLLATPPQADKPVQSLDTALVEQLEHEIDAITDAIQAPETASRTADVYNLQGQKLRHAAKGLNIVGGRKVIF